MSEPQQPEPGQQPARRRRRLTKRARALALSASSLALLLAVAFALPVPYVKLAPGPTFNVIGEDDGRPVIAIDGTDTYPTTGALYLTTVLESGGPRGGLTFVDALASWLNAADAVVPRELIYPDEVDGDAVRTRQAALFSTSESDAVAAAMRHLDRPVTEEVVVIAVSPDTPADGTLEPGDRIRSVGQAPIAAVADVKSAVLAEPVGTTLDFAVDRSTDGTTTARTVQVTSAENPDAPGTAYVGIAVGVRYVPDFAIDFTLQDIGGPSAGLMFALGLVDKLSPEDLAAGRQIAGTGTITPEGSVGPIGGIRQKLAGARDSGAELFLAPVDNCSEVTGHVPEGLTVAAVSTLDEAVAAVRSWTSGQVPAGCPSA